jgi:hypothetical protein
MDFICDIDGTLADLTHRRHYVQTKPANWEAFRLAADRDTVIEPVAHVVRQLEMSIHNRVILCTGRMEKERDLTEKWLLNQRIFYAAFYMRATNDTRPDYVIKEELLDRILVDGFKPVLAFDDRQQVVDMWRRRGLVCAQVAEGNF